MIHLKIDDSDHRIIGVGTSLGVLQSRHNFGILSKISTKKQNTSYGSHETLKVLFLNSQCVHMFCLISLCRY